MFENKNHNYYWKEHHLKENVSIPMIDP
jgi:hypothetical protein